MRQYQSALVLDAAAPCVHVVHDASRPAPAHPVPDAPFSLIQRVQNAFATVILFENRATMQMRCFALAIFSSSVSGSRRERKRNRHHQLIEKSWVLGKVLLMFITLKF